MLFVWVKLDLWFRSYETNPTFRFWVTSILVFSQSEALHGYQGNQNQKMYRFWIFGVWAFIWYITLHNWVLVSGWKRLAKIWAPNTRPPLKRDFCNLHFGIKVQTLAGSREVLYKIIEKPSTILLLRSVTSFLFIMRNGDLTCNFFLCIANISELAAILIFPIKPINIERLKKKEVENCREHFFHPWLTAHWRFILAQTF